MALLPQLKSFVWGEDGRPMTPEEVARERALAERLGAQAGDTSPVGHWSAGAARLVDALGARRKENQANEAERAGLASADAAIQGNPVLAALLGGDQATMQTPSGVQMGAIPAASPGGGLGASLITSESGGNWNALNSEGYGGRGQFGPERLADAARAGIIPAGMTGATYSQAPEEVQLAVENWHKNDILNSLGGYVGVDPDGPGPIPAMTPDSLVAVAHLGGTGGAKKFIESGGRYNPQDSNGTRLSDYAIRHAGGGTGVAAMPAGGMQPQQGPSPVLAALAQAQSNPWVAQKYGPVLQALMQQDMQRSNAQYEQQLRQSDPAYQLGLQKAQLELQQMQQPEAPKPIEVGGVLLDPVTYEPIFDSRSNNGGFDPDRYRVVGNTLFDLAAEDGPSPVGEGQGQEEVIFGPDGNPIMVRGSAGSAKNFTEAQSKDVGFATRMRGAEEQLLPVENALTSFGDRALNSDPTGLLRGAFQSEDYQKARQAGQTWLLAFLRKDSGAATTKEEDAMYGETFLPQPGDGPAVIEQKRAGRDLAMRAVEAGMSPQQALAQVRALGIAQPDESQTPAQPSGAPDFSSMSDAELQEWIDQNG